MFIRCCYAAYAYHGLSGKCSKKLRTLSDRSSKSGILKNNRDGRDKCITYFMRRSPKNEIILTWLVYIK